MKKFILGFLSGLLIMFIGLCIDVYMDYNMVGENVTCDERYVGATYKGTILAQKGDYVYLSGSSEVRLDCTIVESEVTENTPLCGTYIPFEGPIDTSNMNCYKGDKDIQGKLEAYKKQEDEAKEEEKKYYHCNINSSDVVKIYNGCTTADCATQRLKNYIVSNCPYANVY